MKRDEEKAKESLCGLLWWSRRGGEEKAKESLCDLSWWSRRARAHENLAGTQLFVSFAATAACLGGVGSWLKQKDLYSIVSLLSEHIKRLAVAPGHEVPLNIAIELAAAFADHASFLHPREATRISLVLARYVAVRLCMSLTRLLCFSSALRSFRSSWRQLSFRQFHRSLTEAARTELTEDFAREKAFAALTNGKKQHQGHGNGPRVPMSYGIANRKPGRHRCRIAWRVLRRARSKKVVRRGGGPFSSSVGCKRALNQRRSEYLKQVLPGQPC